MIQYVSNRQNICNFYGEKHERSAKKERHGTMDHSETERKIIMKQHGHCLISKNVFFNLMKLPEHPYPSTTETRNGCT